MFCNNCGYKLNDNSKFCGNCGKELSVVRTQNKRTCSKVEAIILIIIIAIISFRFLYLDNSRILEIFDKEGKLLQGHYFEYWRVLLLLNCLFICVIHTIIAYVSLCYSLKVAFIGGIVNFLGVFFSYCYSNTFSYLSGSSAYDLFDIFSYPILPFAIIGSSFLVEKYIIKNREALRWIMVGLVVYVVNIIEGLGLIMLFPNDDTVYKKIMANQFFVYNLLIVIFYTFILWIIKFIRTKKST